jgi:hypothetical protein
MFGTINSYLIAIIVIFFSLDANSQNIPIDYEIGGNGGNWSWTVFENTAVSPPLEIIANPDITGINTSCTVAKFTALQAGNPWAGCESQHGSDLGGFMLNSTNCEITIMVWKRVISDVGIKLVTQTNAALVEIKIPNTVINQWEMLTFDFSSYVGQYPYNVQMVDQIVIFPDFDLNGRIMDNVCYFDHIYANQAPIACSVGQDEIETNEVRLFPNPAEDKLFISSNELIDNIRVFNLSGALVLEEYFSDTFAELVLPNLKTGTYIVETTGNGAINRNRVFIK